MAAQKPSMLELANELNNMYLTATIGIDYKCSITEDQIPRLLELLNEWDTIDVRKGITAAEVQAKRDRLYNLYHSKHVDFTAVNALGREMGIINDTNYIRTIHAAKKAINSLQNLVDLIKSTIGVDTPILLSESENESEHFEDDMDEVEIEEEDSPIAEEEIVEYEHVEVEIDGEFVKIP